MENTCRFYTGQDITQMGSMINANVNEKLEEMLMWHISQNSLRQEFACSFKPVLNRNKCIV